MRVANIVVVDVVLNEAVNIFFFITYVVVVDIECSCG